MSRTFYIADLHFGHRNCIGFDNRPFDTIEEHDEALMANWNAVVGPDDHVYVVGDFAYRNSRPVHQYTAGLHGHVHLIRGNHDKRNLQYESAFESVHDIQKIRDVAGETPVDVVMCHYWIPFIPEQRHGGYMLHGHTHQGSKEQMLEEQLKEEIRQNGGRCKAYNVGCMWQDYYPQTLDQIIARQQIDLS